MTPVLVCASLVAVGFLVCLWSATRNRHAFEQTFPPISDDEFMRRCTPGTSPEVALKVRRIIADTLAIEYERVHPSTRFVEDIGAE